MEEKGKYEAYRAIAGADAKAMAGRIDHLEKLVVSQNKVISDADAAIVSKSKQISTSIEKLTRLESEYETLGADKDAKITNLQSQVATLKDNLTVVYSIIADKDTIISAWDAKFTAAVKISDEWKLAYEGEKKLRLQCEGLVTTLEKRIATQGFVSKLKNVAIVGLAGYAAYDLIHTK